MLKQHSSQQGFAKRVKGLLVASGFAAGSLWAVSALAAESLNPTQRQSGEPIGSSESFDPQPLDDGIYLYGETQQPDQIGVGYMVMEVRNNQAVGALYMPHSSFDCFQGEFQGNQLNMTVVNSYDRTTNTYSFAVQNDNYIASIDDPVSTPARLNGMYNLAEVSANDHRILDTCKADLEGV